MAANQSVSVDLPEELYARIREIAERNERSVEAVLRESLEVLFAADLATAAHQLAQLETYRDDQLWAVVYRRMAWPQRERLRELTSLGKQVSLNEAQQRELATLVEQADYETLLRSHALRLLKQRGHDVDRYLNLGA